MMIEIENQFRAWNIRIHLTLRAVINVDIYMNVYLTVICFRNSAIYWVVSNIEHYRRHKHWPSDRFLANVSVYVCVQCAIHIGK